MELSYLLGFGGHHFTEALEGAIPRNQNSPQRHPKGLYPEQISNTAFTAPRGENLYSWVYRLQPSVVHSPFKKITSNVFKMETPPFLNSEISPNQMRWNPRELSADSKEDFFESLVTICGNGSASKQEGISIHLFATKKENQKTSRYFFSADGDWVFVPQNGALRLLTEMGVLDIEPLEIAVIPRGIRFRIELIDSEARGYLVENFGRPFKLPELGPIGANGLAHPRHFEVPVAAYETHAIKSEIVCKMGGQFWLAEKDGSPLNVVGWTGSLYPYKYDLRKFNTINTVSYDHPDPSIFTVLTSPSEQLGTANCDFVVFPPRWMVGENTFRPPYFHRNVMSEYMGLITGIYDAKESGGFVPGGGSLHNACAAHGPDAETFAKASQAKLEPTKIQNTMAFMFESRFPFAVTAFAQENLLQEDYWKCWQGLKKTAL